MTRAHPFAAFSVAALLSVGGSSSAQQPTLEFQKADGPVGRVHYDMATGRITKLVRPREVQNEQRAASVSTGVQRTNVNSFRNTLSTGYITTVPLGAEYVDWAAKNTRKSLVTAIQFGYFTDEFGPDCQGETGAHIDLAFYEGTSRCTLGPELARLSFAGLPGVTCTGFFGCGSDSCLGSLYVMTAFLAQPIQIPDGNIGWSYATTDRKGNTEQSNSGPFMTDFGTNSGWADSFAWYDSPASLNTCIGTFSWGGCSSGNVPPPLSGGTPCASFYMGLIEYEPGQNASCTSRNAGNPANLAVVNPPQIGGSLLATTTLPFAAYAITNGPLAGTPLSGLINGTLLCDPTVILSGVLLTTSGAIGLPVPPDPGLEGMAVCFQAAEFVGPGNFQLTNAFDCTLGG